MSDEFFYTSSDPHDVDMEIHKLPGIEHRIPERTEERLTVFAYFYPDGGVATRMDFGPDEVLEEKAFLIMKCIPSEDPDQSRVVVVKARNYQDLEIGPAEIEEN